MEYIPGTAEKKAYYSRLDISFRKNLNLITAEASDIEGTILFDDNP